MSGQAIRNNLWALNCVYFYDFTKNDSSRHNLQKEKKSNVDNAHYHRILVCSLNSWASVGDEKQM